ncbi:ABC transporter substrate-binding protein [Paraburkholderia sp. BL21I4N1]|uniref:ABC transporter substrate-binding protein n=1 Tax=Paraburkholderia sp. BL21I4N1 TaxID=1938801 RepID=UPI000CFE22B8|nr:ABC transporter substrate-binding protein [Paraburkholderia sp. BL21I4N1]PQV54848.1 peptide/nickel transport system substrate-binding protein [Paraburkholderia sp. BL21I4N1]
MTINRRKFLHTSVTLLSAGAAVALPRLTAAATPLTPATPAASPSNQPVDGGTLTYAVPEDATQLVSFLDTNTRNRNISAKITEGLLRYDSQFKPQPLLATSWDISADGLRYTFRLRPNVKWHDGQPLTSADVRYSLLTQQKLGPRGRISLANVERIDTPDSLTAVIVLAKPAPYLIKAFSSAELPIVPQHRYGDSDPLTNPNATAPIGTGPFIFDKWVRGSYVSLRRNPDYWRTGTPHLERVIFKVASDPAAISAALETGEADAANNVGLADLARLARNPQLKVDDSYDAYLNNGAFLEFNNEHAALAKPEVRHAIAQAIDRNFIRDNIYYRHASLIDSPVPRVLSSYYEDSTFRYPFDVAAANTALDRAGYRRQADGTRFALRLTYLTGGDLKNTAAYTRSALAKVGIKVTILDGDLPTFLKRVYTTREFDINLNGLGRLYDPSVGVQRFYWGDGVKHPLVWINASHYQNPDVDHLFVQAAVETDENHRAVLFKQVQRIVGRDLPVYPLVSIPSIQVYNTRVRNLNNSVDLMAGDFSDTWLDIKAKT